MKKKANRKSERQLIGVTDYLKQPKESLLFPVLGHMDEVVLFGFQNGL